MIGRMMHNGFYTKKECGGGTMHSGFYTKIQMRILSRKVELLELKLVHPNGNPHREDLIAMQQYNVRLGYRREILMVEPKDKSSSKVMIETSYEGFEVHRFILLNFLFDFYHVGKFSDGFLCVYK